MGLAPNSQGRAAYAPQADNTFSMGMTRNGMRFAVIGAQGSDVLGSSASVGLEVRTRSGSVRLSMVDEDGTVMGTPSYGALRLGRGATTVLVEGDRSFSLGQGGWSVRMYGSIGSTTLKAASGSLVVGSSAIIATRFGLTMNGPLAGGLVSFGLAQPLTVEAGSAHLHLATGYDLESRSLVYGNRDASLRGDRREYQLSAGYERRMMDSTLRFGLSRNMVYRDVAAALSYGLAF
jgi:hypothetical protein